MCAMMAFGQNMSLLMSHLFVEFSEAGCKMKYTVVIRCIIYSITVVACNIQNIL